LIIGTLDTVAWLLVAVGTFLSQSDPATKGLDIFAGIVVTALFLLTGAPALFLAWRAIKLRAALALAIAFPAAFTVLFIGVVIAFA
jgi:hypothetical protein